MILGVLTQLKYDYICNLSQKVEFFLFRMRRKYFESGDKASKLQANCLKQKELSSLTPAIRHGEGELRTKSGDINNMFREFYVNLYTTDTQHNEEHMETFLIVWTRDGQN